MNEANQTGASKPGAFHTTRWSVVLQAREDVPESRAALGELCEAYWAPVHRFLLMEGRTQSDSEELAQEFFARLLKRGSIGEVDPARGSFRSYLLGALKHFLAERRRNQGRLKRGGGAEIRSMDAEGTETSPGLQVPDPGAEVSDASFDKEWALAVMDRGLQTVQAEREASGKQAQWEVLKPWLMGESQDLSQADAATELDLSTGAVKVAVHRMRKEFREAVRAEIAETVDTPDDVAGELRYLIEVLSSA